jgi:CheY-like chemotaxis protein
MLTFRDGEVATEYISHVGTVVDQPELILLDLKLPRRSGFEVLTTIRNTAATKYVPVVILTSSEQDRDIRQAYALGANSYLTKPPTRDALLAMVRSVDSYWLKINRAVGA